MQKKRRFAFLLEIMISMALVGIVSSALFQGLGQILRMEKRGKDFEKKLDEHLLFLELRRLLQNASGDARDGKFIQTKEGIEVHWSGVLPDAPPPLPSGNGSCVLAFLKDSIIFRFNTDAVVVETELIHCSTLEVETIPLLTEEQTPIEGIEGMIVSLDHLRYPFLLYPQCSK